MLMLNSRVVERLQAIADTCPVIWEISSAISGMTAIHTDDWEIEITEGEQTALLKAITGFASELNCAVNCYPMGLTSTVLFDEDGNLL